MPGLESITETDILKGIMQLIPYLKKQVDLGDGAEKKYQLLLQKRPKQEARN